MFLKPLPEIHGSRGDSRSTQFFLTPDLWLEERSGIGGRGMGFEAWRMLE
jgi:hypothetical protein